MTHHMHNAFVDTAVEIIMGDRGSIIIHPFESQVKAN